MEATELNIDVVYEGSYWVVLFEKIINNRRMVAKRRIGKNEPRQTELSKFFESLNYKRLRYSVVPIK
jgi:hypothetical protein